MTIKKLHILLTLSTCLWLGALLAGCSDDNISPALSGDDDLQAVELESFTCKKEPLIETGLGTSFDNKMNMVWSEDDSLLVFVENGQERDSAWFVATDIKGTSSSNFRNPEGKTLKGTRFTFVYNKDNATGITYEQFGVVSGLRIPQMQQKMKNNFDPKAAPMVGTVASDQATSNWAVTMRPVCSFVKYAPAQKDTFSRVELTCSNGACLSSYNLKVDCSGNEMVITPLDQIHSVTLSGEENHDTTYIAVLPVKVGRSLVAMQSNEPWREGFYSEQLHLSDDYAFVRNTRHTGVNFATDSTQMWQRLDGLRLLKTNCMTKTIIDQDDQDSIIIKKYFSWTEAEDYLSLHPGLRMIEYNDFMDKRDQFKFANVLRYSPDQTAAYLNWNSVNHYFPLQGYLSTKSDNIIKDTILSRTWLDVNGESWYTQFDKNKNYEFKPEKSDTMMYNLRLKIPYSTPL